jgi:putative heme iron utilization protein
MRSDLAPSARALVESRGFGILCTQSAKMPGYPFGSLSPYATSPDGWPIFLFSRLAVHTKNIGVDPKGALLVFDPAAEADALNSARVNLVGRIQALAEPDVPACRDRYLAVHPEAAQWVGFGDFGFYRLEMVDIYYVGGFGVMGWVDIAGYAAASAGAV